MSHPTANAAAAVQRHMAVYEAITIVRDAFDTTPGDANAVYLATLSRLEDLASLYAAMATALPSTAAEENWSAPAAPVT